MKINKLSWHYRLLIWFQIHPEYKCRNLCSYFWYVVAALFLCVLLVCFSWLIGIIYLTEKFDAWYKAKYPRKDGPEKDPGLVTLWLKARKSKVCPLIDWSDDEENSAKG